MLPGRMSLPFDRRPWASSAARPVRQPPRQVGTAEIGARQDVATAPEASPRISGAWVRARDLQCTRPRLGVGRRLAIIGMVAGGLGLPAVAHAHPGVEGTRNLSLGSAARSSSFGTNAALINPSNMPFVQSFAVEPLYQVGLRGRRHGLGFVVMDSLNNARISIGLGYLVMRGSPTVSFSSDGPVRLPADGEASRQRDLELVHVAHETFGAIGLAVVKGWLAVGLKPKYQFSSLRYRDAMGVAHDAHGRLSTFGLDISATLNLKGWAAISAMANNVVGNHPPAFTDERELALAEAGAAEGSVDSGTVSPVSDFPLTFEHGLSVFPLHSPDFSLNFDGVYDFSTYAHQEHTRLVYAGSAEFVVGPVPLRLGTQWDGRGPSTEDDRFSVAGGLGYVRPPKQGGVGVDFGVGVRQQVSGPGLGGRRETVIGVNLGLRIRPSL
jgi:hypothetical protein